MGFRLPEAFILLLILAPLLRQAWLGWRRDRETAALFKSAPPSRMLASIRLGCLALFIASLVAVGARPYLVPAVTGNYLLVSDVSRSMEARQSCVEPTLMQRSRHVIRQVIAGMPEGKFGIMAFERLAFPVTQMTYDHAYLNEVIEHGLFVGLIYERTATQFANVLTAIAQKKERLPQIYGGIEYAILVTDGNISPSEEGRFREAIARLNQAGIHMLIVGVGSAGGLPIPYVENGRCLDDAIRLDGKEIQVTLRTDSLRAIANDTQGRYFGESETDELVRFLREQTLRKTPAHTDFGLAQQRDASWVFLALATMALFAMILLGMNIDFDLRGGAMAMIDRIRHFAGRRLVAVLVMLGLVAALLMCPTGASAHIKNEETQYPDIDSSPARFDIVLLAAAGIVPETPVFEPDRPLSRKDLASWLALAKDIARGGENPDVDALARAAVGAGLVESLEGDATFADLDRLFLDGKVTSDRAAQIPTKAEAARYLAGHLTREDLSRRGLTEGPTGTVGNVASAGGNVYILTVGEASYPMYAHGRVAHGPTDLLAWEGRIIARSFIRTVNGRQMWTYLESRPAEARQTQPTVQTKSAEYVDGGNNVLLYGLIAAIVVLGGGLFFRGKRSG